MRVNRILTAFVILMLSMSMTSFAYVSANSRQELPRQTQGLRPGAKHSQQNITPGVSACSYDFSRPTVLFHRNRQYNPKYGRWLSRDPISFSGGNNLWGYAGNNPVLNVDPTGLWLIRTTPDQKIVAEAEKDGEDIADLVPPFPSSVTKARTACGPVTMGEQVDITAFFPGAIQNVVGKGGLPNCFAATKIYPGASVSQPPLNRDDFMTWLEANYSSVSQQPQVGSIVRFYFPGPGTKTLPNGEVLGAWDPIHVGNVVYVSKVSGKPSIFNKLGTTGNFTIQPLDLIESLYQGSGVSFKTEFWQK